MRNPNSIGVFIIYSKSRANPPKPFCLGFENSFDGFFSKLSTPWELQRAITLFWNGTLLMMSATKNTTGLRYRGLSEGVSTNHSENKALATQCLNGLLKQMN